MTTDSPPSAARINSDSLGFGDAYIHGYEVKRTALALGDTEPRP